jgi:hypothetical protein
VSLVASAIPMLAVVMVALGSTGLSVALPTLALCLVVVGKVIPALRRLKSAETMHFNSTPVYLTSIPVLLLLGQLLLARPLTDYSRNRAIARAEPLIRDIEQHRAIFDRYPASLLALHQDYSASVVGIPEYHYAASGEAYNLFFEQPRFVFDDIGSRELVVFNKLDQHVILSHAAWILVWPPERLAANQGWFAVRDTSQPHWKSFSFD